jgi:hypothetical protein
MATLFPSSLLQIIFNFNVTKAGSLCQGEDCLIKKVLSIVRIVASSKKKYLKWVQEGRFTVHLYPERRLRVSI